MAKTPSQLDVKVGVRLREARKMRGITQPELGEALGVTFQQIQKYEKGADRIAAARLYHAARFLQVDWLYFFED